MLRTILWNKLFAGYPDKRAFAHERILKHYERFALAKKGLDMADVRYVSSRMLLLYLRKTFYLTDQQAGMVRAVQSAVAAT